MRAAEPKVSFLRKAEARNVCSHVSKRGVKADCVQFEYQRSWIRRENGILSHATAFVMHPTLGQLLIMAEVT